MLNYFFNELDGYIGLESPKFKKISAKFSNFIEIGDRIRFSHKWKFLKSYKKKRSNLVGFLSASVFRGEGINLNKDLELEWLMLFVGRDANRLDVMNFDFDCSYVIVEYRCKENYIALIREDIFRKKIKQIKATEISIHNFDLSEAYYFRLGIFLYPELIEIKTVNAKKMNEI